MRTLLTPCVRLYDLINFARLSSKPAQLMFGLGITNALREICWYATPSSATLAEPPS